VSVSGKISGAGNRRFPVLVLLAATLVLAACSGGDDSPAAPAAGERFVFGVIGDYPYGADQFPKFDRLIEMVNEERPALVLHVGDVGGQPCTDAALNTSLATLHKLTMPVIFTPGDNEWTDCHEAGADPFQRLTRVRQLFFPTDQSLGGRTLTLTRQSAEYPENSRFDFGGITFVAVHWVGSNNGAGRTPEGDAEAAARSAAGLEWVRAGYAAAKAAASKGIVIFFQADPNFDLYRLGIRNAHTDLLRTFERESIDYRRPVLLVHGDTHVFRVDQALLGSSDTPVSNVTRLENFGSPNVHWSRVTVDPSGPALFTFSPGIVGGNALENTPR
jgi:hypothetical protein